MLAICLCMLTACSPRNTKAFTQGDKISVVTTIYPVYDFTCHVAGDKAEIINLVPAGVEPHDFELTTGDMQLLEQADIFIYNGADMEHFVDKTLKSVSNENLVVVECAKGLELIEAEHSHSHDDEENEYEEDNLGKQAEVSKEQSEDAHDHEGESLDPHTWLSIDNAIKETEAIKDALVAFDKDNASYYENNFNAYKEELEELKALYEAELSGLSKDTIVVAHEAFGYLCAEYDLHQEGIEGLTAESEPDSARMKEIIDFCREQEVKVIFFEELVSPKVAEAIASEIGAETMVLNPIEGLTAEQEDEGLDYIGLMKQNLEALKKALQ